MKHLPESINDYLNNLDSNLHLDGYLCLNEKHEILTSDGRVGATNLKNINRTINPIQLIPLLEGLLHDSTAAPTVIKHAHVDQDYYFDIHIFNDHAGNWVLFVDQTIRGKLLQEAQQIRLVDDYKNDKRRTGS